MQTYSQYSLSSQPALLSKAFGLPEALLGLLIFSSIIIVTLESGIRQANLRNQVSIKVLALESQIQDHKLELDQNCHPLNSIPELYICKFWINEIEYKKIFIF